jgi:hypothetical protein
MVCTSCRGTEKLKLLLQNELYDITVVYRQWSFILQDAVQGFYGANNQATLHLFVVYIEDQHLQTLSFYVFSDCLGHDTLSFYARMGWLASWPVGR